MVPVKAFMQVPGIIRGIIGARVASPTCQDAGVLFSKRASRERHGGHLLVAHVASLNKSTRCQNSQAQLPVATIQIMAWTARVGDLPTAKPPLSSSLCLSRLRSLRRLVPGVACTIPRLRSSQAMEADVPLVSRKEGNAPLPAAVG